MVGTLYIPFPDSPTALYTGWAVKYVLTGVEFVKCSLPYPAIILQKRQINGGASFSRLKRGSRVGGLLYVY